MSALWGMGVPGSVTLTTPWTVAILAAAILTAEDTSAIMTSGKNELQISNQTLPESERKS